MSGTNKVSDFSLSPAQIKRIHQEEARRAARREDERRWAEARALQARIDGLRTNSQKKTLKLHKNIADFTRNKADAAVLVQRQLDDLERDAVCINSELQDISDIVVLQDFQNRLNSCERGLRQMISRGEAELRSQQLDAEEALLFLIENRFNSIDAAC